MVIRKRFTAEDIAKINEELYRRTHQNNPPHDGGNSGTLVLDGTAAPADVRYLADTAKTKAALIVFTMNAAYCLRSLLRLLLRLLFQPFRDTA